MTDKKIRASIGSGPPEQLVKILELEPVMLNTKDAARFIGGSHFALRQSRGTGKLFGVKAPAYVKFGTKLVRYNLQTLKDWLNQFTEQNNTAETIK